MTDDEKRELIAEARKWRDEQLPPTPFGDGHIANRLADALEGTLTEPDEWDRGRGVLCGPLLILGSRASDSGKVVNVRRRKAGPWMEVPDV